MATASASVAISHDSTVAVNRTPANLLNAPQVRGLPEVLGAVVDDAHQSRAGRHRRIPVGVHDAGQFLGGDSGDVLEGELVHRVVVAGQQVRGRLHLGHVVGTVSVTGVVAREVQSEPVHPAV